MRVSELLEDEERSDMLEMRRAVKAIVKDCQPFLRKFGGDRLLYRGSRSISHGPQVEFSKRKVRADRRPMNTAEDVHRQMDDWFEKRFDVRARSSTLFATGNFREAKGYGTVYAVFPIGEFRHFWSEKIEDLYVDLREKDEHDVAGFLDAAGYTTGNLPAALESGHEVMVECKEYYLVMANTPNDRMELLRMLNETE